MGAGPGHLSGQAIFEFGYLRRVSRLEGLHLVDVPLLVATLLEVGGRPHVELEDQGVGLRVQIALRGKQVKSKEPDEIDQLRLEDNHNLPKKCCDHDLEILCVISTCCIPSTLRPRSPKRTL